MKHKPIIVVLLIQILAVVGCTSEPKDLSGQSLPATTPEQVKIYQKKPGNYDIVGNLEIPLTADMAWDKHGQATRMFDSLKSKAAAMGANGILFELNPTEYDMGATAGYDGKFYIVPLRTNSQQAAVAKAIWVKSS